VSEDLWDGATVVVYPNEAERAEHAATRKALELARAERNTFRARVVELEGLLEMWVQDENWQRNEGKRLNFPTEAYMRTEAVLKSKGG
jgi:hypothetical protein